MSAFVHKTIGELIKDTSTRYPKNIALISPEFGIRQTYREFYQTCQDVAQGLMAIGIKRGDHIAVWTTNIPEWTYLQCSLGMTGGVLVSVNTNYQTHELEYILKQSDSTTLFLIDAYRDTSFYDTVRKIAPELDSCKAGSLVSGKLPLLKNVIYIGKKENTPGMFKFLVIDPETGDDVSANVQGEIVTSSTCVMKGYYKMPEATAEAIDKEGWLHTGDLGEVDENGYFKVTGRIKDMIIRGGENIYPRELEEFLYKNPEVMNVQVIGISDKKYGEQVLAAVQLKTGKTASAEDFIEFCKGKIARHKIPKYWEFVDSYPMTASGKIQKFKMREIFEKNIRLRLSFWS